MKMALIVTGPGSKDNSNSKRRNLIHNLKTPTEFFLQNLLFVACLATTTQCNNYSFQADNCTVYTCTTSEEPSVESLIVISPCFIHFYAPSIAN